MDDGVLRVPVSAGGQVQVRLAPVADRDVFNPAGWRHEDLQPTGAAGWFERDLDGLGLADGEYEYELVVDGREDAPVPDPFARAITRFDGYRGLFSVAGGVVVSDPFRWDDEFPGGIGLPQNNRLVVYEMPVRWMTGEDSSGPNDSPGIRQVGLGRFEQVRFRHIEDLARLGVNAIELMPIQDSPDTLNWGYGTRFFFAPDLDMGTPTDLKCLVKRCHQLGIRVILDVVMNHSRDCPLETLAHDWYYLRSDEESGRQDWGGQRFRYADQAPAGVWSAREFHRRMATFWIQEYRLDGFRLDDFADINNWDFVQAFREHAWEVQRDTFGDRPFIVIAEDSNRRATITQDAPPNPGGRKTVDAVWNFSYQQDVRLLLRDQLATSAPISRRQRVEAAIAGTGVWDGLGNQLQPGFTDLAQVVDYLTSHDVQQVDAQRLMSVMVSDAFSLWGQTNPIASARFLVDTLGRLPDPPLAYLTALDRVRAAFGLLLTSVGIPMFLAGEEFGDVHDVDPGDWRLKMSDPVDWERGRAELYPAHGELQGRVAELIALRATQAALQRDEIDFFHYHPTFDDWNGERVFAYCRTGGAPRGAAGQVVVVANCGAADYHGGDQLQWFWAGVGQEHGAPLRAEAAATVAGGRATVPLLPFDVRVFSP